MPRASLISGLLFFFGRPATFSTLAASAPIDRPPMISFSISSVPISAFLSSDASSETVPIKIYSNVRGSPTPALNALATAMLIGTTIAIALAVVSLRLFRRGGHGSAVEDFARLDI